MIDRPVDGLAGVNLIDLIHPSDAPGVRTALGALGTCTARLFVADDSWLPVTVALQGLAKDRVMATLVAAHDLGPRIPDETVADERAAVRASVGDSAKTPMIEIDGQGRTVFVAGPWADLSPTGAPGADAFEELLIGSSQAEEIMDAVEAALASGLERRFQLAGLSESQRLLVRAIPSPHIAGEHHVLVAVTSRPNLGEAPPSASAVTAVDADEVSRANDADDAGEPANTGGSRRTRVLVALGLVAVALVALILFGDRSSTPDETAEVGPLPVEIIATESQSVGDGLAWRPLGIGGFGEAHGVAAVGDGAIIASVDGQLAQLDASGAATTVIGLGGTDISSISDVAGDGKDSAWALDAGSARLYLVDSAGNVQLVSSDPRFLQNARGVGRGANDTAWIASTAAAQLTQVASNGTVVAEVPTPDRQPSDVFEAADGTLWMIDSQEFDLVQLTTDGDEMTVVGLRGFTSLESPHLAQVGRELWLTDPELSAIIVIDPVAGEQVDVIELRRPGGEPVVKPIGIAVGADGRTWVSDSLGTAILIIDS